MPKGRRKRVGDFRVGDKVEVKGVEAKVVAFPTRRTAVVESSGVVKEVSTLDLEKREGDED